MIRALASAVAPASRSRLPTRVLTRNFAAGSATSFLVLDETKQPLADIVKTPDAKVVAYFTATWCGPCKRIAPVFAEEASKHADVKFVKIDIDENGSTTEAHRVASVPTFIGFADGKQIDQFSGSSPAQLAALVAAVQGK